MIKVEFKYANLNNFNIIELVFQQFYLNRVRVSMKLKSRSMFILRKLKNDIQVAYKIIESKTCPFSFVGQIMDEMNEIRIDNLKEENPQLNERQILKLIRNQNEVEIKIRDLRRKMRFDRI